MRSLARSEMTRVASAQEMHVRLCCTCVRVAACGAHHEEEAEVGQLAKEVLRADHVRVEGEVVAHVLVELLHVLVHGGQLLVLLPRMLGEAVSGGVESRSKGQREGRSHAAIPRRLQDVAAWKYSG